MTDDHTIPNWLHWARELHQIGQTGLFYTVNEFDRQRFQRCLDIAGEMMADHMDTPLEEIKTALIAQPGYITPKVDVRGAVFQDGKILLVQEMLDGMWSLPGGWADVNEAPSVMVEREVWEEAGLRVKARKLVGVYEANHDRDPVNALHSYKLLFLCDYLSGELTTSYETPDVRFFDLDELPELSIYRTHQRHIKEAVAHWQNPGRAAAFD